MSDDLQTIEELQKRIAALETELAVWKETAFQLRDAGVELANAAMEVAKKMANVSGAAEGKSECSPEAGSDVPPSHENTSGAAQA